ncbi:single-strand DNA-binding protein [Salinibacillus kushneri]|uniref:Single-stranded DNA-binding protein n=1 Tax=Salinibacillus kushneri TaxID=237682 RepID=A0A1H9Z6N0_9BACI|nr:single-strand DNA-binding protein [Salinibacillus kushneri]
MQTLLIVLCGVKPAENLANYTKKGDMIGVDGRIQTRNFEGNDGKRVFVTEVVAESVQFLDSKGKNSSSQQPSQPKNNTLENEGDPIDLEDDLPF